MHRLLDPCSTPRATAARWLLLAALVAPVLASAAPGLSLSNYVDTADAIVDMIATSGLAFSTTLLGEVDAVRPRNAMFTVPSYGELAPSFDTPCPHGGSISSTMSDVDRDGRLSVNDRLVTVFASCRIENDVVSGRSEFVVSAHREEGAVEVTELAFRFTRLGTDTLRWDGPATVTLRSDRLKGTEHYVVDYRDLSVRRLGRPHRWNFRLELRRPPWGEQTAAFNGRITVGAMPLRLSQDEPFVIGRDGRPRSGRLAAVDEAGARLQVEAGRRRYTYRYFVDKNRSERADSTSHSPS
jgi:hypothetical protein